MRVLDIAELLLLAALWGGSFLFMWIAASVLGPVWLIEFRVLLAGLVLLPVLARLGLLRQMRRNLIPPIVASLWLREKLTTARIVGFILGFAGVIVLVGWKAIRALQGCLKHGVVPLGLF